MSKTPVKRPRRLRRSPAIRNLVGESDLTASNLILPLFVTHGTGIAREVASMPGVHHLSVDGRLDELCERAGRLGVKSVMLFGLPKVKDEIGRENFAPDGIVQRAIERIRASAPELVIFTDVCCCGYTSHGHCGIVRDGEVDNDKTLEVLGRVAVSRSRCRA